MQTDKISLNDQGDGLAEALEAADRFAEYHDLPRRDALHVRLLTEETVGMVKAMTVDFSALFWIEGEKDQCELHLVAHTPMDRGKRKELLSVSSSGRNTAARTLMGKIQELMELGLEGIDDEQPLGSLTYGTWGIEGMETDPGSYTWSLDRYRDSVRKNRFSHDEGAPAWDELEKSVVANLADNIEVGIQKDKVQLTIFKRLSGR